MASPGDRIDIWEVERALGAGGMGSVYRCHNAQAPRILAAVKVLERSLRTSDDAVQRFVREAEILNRLDHPNVVRVRNVRMDHDPPFIEMEFVEGASLEELIDGRALPLRQAWEVFEQLVSALVYIHAQNVRHRDIKPANLLIADDGRVKLVDFGLAVETDLSRITQAGMTFGTVSYAPPEWIDPARVEPVQWDLYASGVVLYEMILGLAAFPAAGHGSPKQQALQIMLHKQSAPPLDLGEPYPDELRSLVRDLTAAEPSQRPPSAAAVLARMAVVREVLDRRGWDITAGPMPSEIATAVPVHRRRTSSLHSLLSLAPKGVPSRVLLTALGASTLGAAAVGAGVALVQPVGPPPERDLLVAVEGAPEDYPVALRIDGAAPLLREAAGWLFERVPVGTRELTWVAGQSCAPDACTDEGCPPWCGVGGAPVEVLEGDGPQRLSVPLELPAPGVVVSVPAIQDTRVGLFRRKPDHKLTATLDGRLGGVVDEYKAAWRAVVPGKRELVVSVGECPPEAIGCWPHGTCPDTCRSTVREVVVPFGDDDVVLTLDLPVPTK